MAAFRRGRRPYLRRRKRRRRSRNVLSRRKKQHSRQRRKTRTKYITRSARSCYRKRHLPTSRHLGRRIRDNVLPSQSSRYAVSSYRSKGYHRKPLQRGRPKKKKHYIRIRSGHLQTKLKRKSSKGHAKHVRAAREKKSKSPKGGSDNELFYNLANTSTPKTASDEKQSKKHSVRFTTPGNSKAKEMEPQEDLSMDNSSNQQAVTPKKRSRNSATPVFKTH